MRIQHGGGGTGGRLALAACAGLLLAGCEAAATFNPFKSTGAAGGAGQAAADSAPDAVRLGDRDVEAPEIFQVTDKGLWDGRPSLGGIWVAHPDVAEPQRVIIRNDGMSKSVTGALFRRERANPGPVLQVSSDAAAALGMLAGAPATLNVTALRRTPAAADPASPVETNALDPAAKTMAEARPAAADAAETALARPFVQVATFTAEESADRAAERLRAADLSPTVVEGDAGGTPVWRVVAGPAQGAGERDLILQKLGALGYDDAYPVTN